jgi:hypothetical protein
MKRHVTQRLQALSQFVYCQPRFHVSFFAQYTLFQHEQAVGNGDWARVTHHNRAHGTHANEYLHKTGSRCFRCVNRAFCRDGLLAFHASNGAWPDDHDLFA